LTNTNAGQGEEDIWVKNSIYTDPDVGLNYYIRDDEGNWSLDTFEGEEGDTLGRFYQIDSSGGISTNTYKIDGSVSLGNVFIPSELYSGSLSSFFVGVQTGCSWTGVSTASGTASVEWNADTGQLTPILGLISPGSGALTVPVGAVCSDLATKQQQLLDEIDSTRVGITTWFVSVNTTKQRKHGSQLQLWSVERVKIRNQEETDGLNNSPRNIETTIPSVETVDSELPTNSNTADADRGNLTADNTLITADSK
jgi:hypothetical protein